MFIPPLVSFGARIGIVAPASPPDHALIHHVLTQLQLVGYEPVPGSAIFQQYGFLAGTDEERLRDLHVMFADPTIEAILCLRGGYGSIRIVDQLDFDLIRMNPKWLIGYSDITTLLVAIYQETGLLTMHGPMLMELSASFDANWWSHLWKRLQNPAWNYRYLPTNDACTLFSGTAMGPLTGGNLTLLASSLGTPFEIDTEGHILFIEEIGENPYRIDRMLTQLRLAGKLQVAAGIVFGHFTDCNAPVGRPSIPLRDILHDHISQLCIPSYIGFPAGHSLPNQPFPVGAPAWIDADSCLCTVFPN